MYVDGVAVGEQWAMPDNAGEAVKLVRAKAISTEPTPAPDISALVEKLEAEAEIDRGQKNDFANRLFREAAQAIRALDAGTSIPAVYKIVGEGIDKSVLISRKEYDSLKRQLTRTLEVLKEALDGWAIIRSASSGYLGKGGITLPLEACLADDAKIAAIRKEMFSTEDGKEDSA